MKIILSILFIGFHLVSSAQTIGISEVIAVESKVVAYENNEEKMQQLRNKIPELEKQWRDHIAILRNELAALIKERDNLIADMKVGARCSQCGGWKSDFEKKGENFEKHLGDVKGYAIPATTTEIESTRKSFSEKIAIKKVQLQNLEKGDKAISNQYDEIEKIRKINLKLCEDITQHSKSYEKKLIEDAKIKHNLWLEDVVNLGSKALIQNNMKKIFIAEKSWMEEEFHQQNERALSQIKDNNSSQRDKIKQKIEDNTHLISQLDIEKEKERLEAIREENRQLSFDITSLLADLSKEQAQKTQELKDQFNLKISELKKLETESGLKQKQLTEEFNQKFNQYKQKENTFIKEITAESNRMSLAASRINCSVWNATAGSVNLNWNKLTPCSNGFSFPDTMMPHDIIGNSSCSNEPFFKNGTSVYKSFFEGLTAKEQQVLLR